MAYFVSNTSGFMLSLPEPMISKIRDFFFGLSAFLFLVFELFSDFLLLSRSNFAFKHVSLSDVEFCFEIIMFVCLMFMFATVSFVLYNVVLLSCSCLVECSMSL